MKTYSIVEFGVPLAEREVPVPVAEGRAVVVISSELMELIGLCHRVAVMRAGRLVATLDGEQLNEKELIAHATGTR